MSSVVWIPVFFSLASFGLYTLSVNFPEHTGKYSNSSDLKFPTNMDELQKVAGFLQEYKSDHHIYVLIIFVCAFLYKQTFAIPGSVFMNLLAGALYGTWVGFPLSCFLTSCGATFCFMLSKLFGKDYIVHYFPEKVTYFQNMVDENTDSLFFFILFLRIFPGSPNWFMNMVSPIVNIPVHTFFLTMFIGSMPYIFICVHTGCMLSEISSLDDIFTMHRFLQMIGIALVALLPGFLIKKYSKKNSKKD